MRLAYTFGAGVRLRGAVSGGSSFEAGLGALVGWGGLFVQMVGLSRPLVGGRGSRLGCVGAGVSLGSPLIGGGVRLGVCGGAVLEGSSFGGGSPPIGGGVCLGMFGGAVFDGFSLGGASLPERVGRRVSLSWSPPVVGGAVGAAFGGLLMSVIRQLVSS